MEVHAVNRLGKESQTTKVVIDYGTVPGQRKEEQPLREKGAEPTMEGQQGMIEQRKEEGEPLLREEGAEPIRDEGQSTVEQMKDERKQPMGEEARKKQMGKEAEPMEEETIPLEIKEPITKKDDTIELMDTIEKAEIEKETVKGKNNNLSILLWAIKLFIF